MSRSSSASKSLPKIRSEAFGAIVTSFPPLPPTFIMVKKRPTLVAGRVITIPLPLTFWTIPQSTFANVLLVMTETPLARPRENDPPAELLLNTD